MNKATCRGCGAPIVWIKTPAGKAMPCDPAPVYYKATPDGAGRQGQGRHHPGRGRELRDRPRGQRHRRRIPAALGHLPAGRNIPGAKIQEIRHKRTESEND